MCNQSLSIGGRQSCGLLWLSLGKMTKAKKKLVASAPWRGEEDGAEEEFKDAKLKVTNQPGGTPTMHVPRKKSIRSKDQDPDDSLSEIDPELRYSFQRNFQVLIPLLLSLFFHIHFTAILLYWFWEQFCCLVCEFIGNFYFSHLDEFGNP